MPPPIFLASPQISQDRIDEIRALLLRFGKSSEGKAYLEGMDLVDPFGEVTADILVQLKELSPLVEMKRGVNSGQE